MNRREFIKDMAIVAGGVAGASLLGASVFQAAVGLASRSVAVLLDAEPEDYFCPVCGQPKRVFRRIGGR